MQPLDPHGSDPLVTIGFDELSMESVVCETVTDSLLVPLSVPICATCACAMLLQTLTISPPDVSHPLEYDNVGHPSLALVSQHGGGVVVALSLVGGLVGIGVGVLGSGGMVMVSPEKRFSRTPVERLASIVVESLSRSIRSIST